MIASGVMEWRILGFWLFCDVSGMDLRGLAAGFLAVPTVEARGRRGGGRVDGMIRSRMARDDSVAYEGVDGPPVRRDKLVRRGRGVDATVGRDGDRMETRAVFL